MKKQNRIKISSNNEQNNSKNTLKKKEKLSLKDSNSQNNQNNENQQKSENNQNNQKDINNNNKSSGNISNFFKELWANKLKRYILIGVISTVVIAIIVVAVVVSVTKKKNSNSDLEEKPSNSNSNSNTNSNTNSNSDSSNSSNEPDLIDPDCTGACDKPYDIKVYSDSKLKSKLKECEYEENSELFNFVLAAIKRHNILRACHNAEPLMFNCEILKISQDYAQTQPSGHSGTRFNGQYMGENYFYSNRMTLTGDYPVNDWYKEISHYDFDTGPINGVTTGHFTQVVWKNSKEFGIGYYCNGGDCYVIGNYFPGGNYEGQYLNQVQAFQQ